MKTILAALFLLGCASLARADEPCGPDGCPAKVKLVGTPTAGALEAQGYVRMPAGPFAHPVVAAVRLNHPVRMFLHNHRHPIRTFIAKHRR